MNIPSRTALPRSQFKNILKITHYIRIPLLNQTSSSQIQETLCQVANDPIAAAVPRKAYQPLQRLSLGVAGLSLPTEESKNKAITLLQELGNQDWQKIFSKVEAARSSTSTMNPESLCNGHFKFSGPRPLVVSTFFHVIISSVILNLVLRAKYSSCSPNRFQKPYNCP